MPTTLGEMVDNVLVKLGDPSGQYFTTAEVKKNIGDAFRYYYFVLIRMAEGFFETTTDLDIVQNDENVSIASLDPPFKSISQLWRYVTNGRIPLKQQEDRFVPVYTLAIAAGDAYLPKYKQRGTNIVLDPPPGADETEALKLDYVYMPTFPNSSSSDSFTFDDNFPNVYEVNVEIRAAIKCLESKDASGGVSDIATFRNELAELDKAFEESAENDEYPDSVQYMGVNYRNGGYY